jgi:hypothetical protein
MAIKNWTVAIHFPEAVGHRNWHAVDVIAPDFGLAARRGFEKIRKREGVKRKHFSEAKFTITEARPDE